MAAAEWIGGAARERAACATLASNLEAGEIERRCAGLARAGGPLRRAWIRRSAPCPPWKRHSSPERDHRIFERDGWRCAVPGCTSYRNLQAHHKHFRSHGGDDAPENLITLCAWHHQRALHEDRVIRVVGRAHTRFEIGVRPDRPPLSVFASGDVVLSA